MKMGNQELLQPIRIEAAQSNRNGPNDTHLRR
ncbi:hypothetical protein DES34_110112 [Brevibacillus brevis]|nr:hypothetical protein DES34_110112 [Brevibacillus brevis]VEF91274.1 Uncharacterised protein [Brevibacillus brevis]